MCEPVTIGLGLAAFNTFANIGKDMMQANAQQDAADKNKQSALAAERLSNQALTLRQMQEQAAAQQSLFQGDLDYRRADAKARVMAGEAGVAGSSVDAVLGDLDMQRSRNAVATQTNLANSMDQIALQRQQVHAQTLDRINSVVAPNPWATVLQIGGDVLQGAGSFMKQQPSPGGK